MSDYLKKGFLLGLGAAVSGKEKLEQKLKDLVEKNELSQDQAKTVMEDFIEKGDNQKQKWSEKQKEQTQKLAAEYGIATTEDIDELKGRIHELEMKLSNKTDEEKE